MMFLLRLLFLAVTFLLCLHLAEQATVKVGAKGSEGWGSSLLSLLIRALIPSRGATLMTSSQPDYLPKVPSPNTITMGVSTLTYDF